MKKSELLGTRAVALGFVTQEQVAHALERQSARRAQGEPHMPLGLLMVEAGALTAGQLATLLGQDASSVFHVAEDAVRLAARLHAALGGEHRVLVITGASRHEGVTTVAAQVGLALALMDEGTVLLVDANLRAPELHARFALAQSPGLSDVVEGKIALDAAVARTGIAGLALLPSGRSDVDFIRLLLSEESAQLLRRMRETYRLTVLVAPPILPAAETATLAARSDGVVTVVAGGHEHRSDVAEVQRVLAGLNANLLGVVLTQPVRSGRRARTHRGSQ